MLFSETLPFAVMQAVFISISDYMGVSPHFIKGAGRGGGAIRHRFTPPLRRKKNIELDFARSGGPISLESTGIQSGYIRSI